jgi:beta-hydroxylase
MYYPAAQFPFTATLEGGWRSIRKELEDLHATNFVPWPERFLYAQGWEVFGLYAFGRKLDRNCELCPETTHLIEQIPGLTTAGFSSLAPGTHIAAHTGYTKSVLRCHLGLIVPPGCSMRVGAETREWREGECLVFDDTIEHEVWHRGDRPRVILLLDFMREGALKPALEVPQTVIRLVESVAGRDQKIDPV